MDETLLRRLLGAAALLLAAFVLTSLLPDPATGPPSEEGRLVTYDLRTGRPLDAPAAPQDAAPLPKPKLKVAETLDAAAAGWFVQVASFGNQANARAALKNLYSLGLPTVIEPEQSRGVLWYRLRVGPYPSEPAAREALVRVREQGYADAKLVQPQS